MMRYLVEFADCPFESIEVSANSAVDAELAAYQSLLANFDYDEFDDMDNLGFIINVIEVK